MSAHLSDTELGLKFDNDQMQAPLLGQTAIIPGKAEWHIKGDDFVFTLDLNPCYTTHYSFDFEQVAQLVWGG